MTSHGDFPSVSEICAHFSKKRLNYSRTANSRDSASEFKRAETPLVPGRVESADKSKDQDRGKGAMEQDPQNQGGNTSMQGQLGHRDEDAELKNADSDLSG